MTYKYAIQNKESGQLMDYCDTEEQVQWWLGNYQIVEIVDINHASKIIVTYTELGGPWGYGHQEEPFTTYGGLKACISNLCKWMQSTASTFGPDARDVKDFFRHCSLYVNDTNKTQWLLGQIGKIDNKTIFA